MSPTAVADATTFQLIPVTKIQPSPLNPRKHFDATKLEELAATMGNGVGIIEPIVVRPFDVMKGIGRDPGKAARNEFPPFEIVAGERRWRAAQIAGLTDVPAIVKEIDDAHVLEIMVIENDQREDINPLEEGDGFKRLMTFGFDIDKLAGRIGRSRKYIYDRVKLLDLIEPARELLLSGRINAGHAILIARLAADQQRRVLHVSKRNGYGTDEGPLFEHEALLHDPENPDGDAPKKADPYAGMKARSVRELERWIAQHCRFDTESPVSQELFPDTIAAVEEAKKVIHITYNHQVTPEGKEGDTQRIYSVVTWRRADGHRKSKTCAKSVTGVFVVGPHRGESMEVCVNKDCDVHFGAEKRAKAKASTSTALQSKYRQEEAKRQERYKREREERERDEKIWKAAVPDILKAIAGKLRSIPIAAVIADHLELANSHHLKEARTLLGLDTKVPEEALRVLLMADFLGDTGFYARKEFKARTKGVLGLDITAIEQTAAKAQTPAPEAKSVAKPVPGVCRYCGCTEDMACGGGCAWVDKEETVCSTASCVAAHKKAAKKAATKKAAKKR